MTASDTRPVIIDHLAFSCPISALRHVHKAVPRGFTVDNNPSWPAIPKPDWKMARNEDDKQKRVTAYQAKFRDVMEQRLVRFFEMIMGAKLRPMRGRGLHGYLDSCIMVSPCGIELGFFAIGGNADTFYCQFSGDGCRYMFNNNGRRHNDQRIMSPFMLHWWLCDVLGVTQLSRIDLAVDDFDGLFDCKYAETAYFDGAFRRSNRGLNPTFEPKRVYQDTQNGPQLVNEGTIIGSRKSKVYWRIYNKALEQKLKDITWYRSEVELKKVPVDVLAKPAAYFAGLCAFAASIEPTEGLSIQQIAKKTGLDLVGRTHWLRRQCSRTFSEVIEKYDGDIAAVMGLLINEEYLADLNAHASSKLAIPSTHYELLQFALNKEL